MLSHKRICLFSPIAYICTGVCIGISLCTATLCGEPIESAAPQTVGMSATKLRLVTPALQQLVDQQRLAGTTALILRRGKLVYFKSFGLRDVAQQLPMKNDTILRFYSMTKPITSVAAMMLVEQGKIKLSDDIAKYAPQFKQLKVFTGFKSDEITTTKLKRPVTIRDLMRHTSGFTYGFLGNTAIDQQYNTLDVLSRQNTLTGSMNILGTIPLLYQPGERFNYSVSTDVLGYIVERVSGVDLATFFGKHIFRPLGMDDTAFQVAPQSKDRFASVYSAKLFGGITLSEASVGSPFLRKPRLYSGGGGLVSTAMDYARFCQMLLNQGTFNGTRLLKPATVAEMTKNQLPPQAYPMGIIIPRPGIGFGLGFSVVVESVNTNLPRRIGEYGWSGMASTHFWISPKDDLAVVVLSQLLPYTPQLEMAIRPLIYEAIDTCANK
ncbi:MAG: serine hydrolase domain-containing protein [Pirellulaceae bacterium]